MVDAHRVVEVDPVAIGKLYRVASIATVRKATVSGLFAWSERFLMLFLELCHELFSEIFKACSRNYKDAN